MSSKEKPSIAGERMKILRWASGGDKPEPFPRFAREVATKAATSALLRVHGKGAA